MNENSRFNYVTKLATIIMGILIIVVLFYCFVFLPLRTKSNLEKRNKFVNCIRSLTKKTLEEKGSSPEILNKDWIYGVDAPVEQCCKTYGLQFNEETIKLGYSVVKEELDISIEGLQKSIGRLKKLLQK